MDFLLTMKKWLEKLNSDLQLPDGHAFKDTFEAAKKCHLAVAEFSERDRSLKGLPGCFGWLTDFFSLMWGRHVIRCDFGRMLAG